MGNDKTSARMGDVARWLTDLADSCAYLKDVDTEVSLKEIREQRLRDRYPEYFNDEVSSALELKS